MCQSETISSQKLSKATILQKCEWILACQIEAGYFMCNEIFPQSGEFVRHTCTMAFKVVLCYGKYLKMCYLTVYFQSKKNIFETLEIYS